MDHASKENTAVDDSDPELVEWLLKTKLHFYQQALEAEGQCVNLALLGSAKLRLPSLPLGYDTLESLTLVPEAEITELAIAIQMKPGEICFPICVGAG